MSRQPSAELVYGVYISEPMRDHVLEKIGYRDDGPMLNELFEEYAAKHNLDVTLSYGWDESGYVITGRNTDGFSAYEDPRPIPGVLPGRDPQDVENLLAVAEDLGVIDPPGWWLVPFYG